jgi:EAL domain-containing protein (putative c-di-GMP-specific phosphodiesterase class I)
LTAQPDIAPHAPSRPDRARAFVRLHARALAEAEVGRLVVGATAFVVAVGSILACLGGASALLFDNLQELVAAAGGAVGLWLASRHCDGPTRRLLGSLTISLGAACCGMLAWDLAPVAGTALDDAGDVVFVASVGFGVVAMLRAIFGGLGRDELVGVATDTLILFLAGIAVVASTWEGSDVATAARMASVGAVLLVAATGGCVFALIARRIAPARAGPWPLFVGATVLGMSWLIWIGDPAAPTTVGLSDFLFSAGILLIAYGGVTWDATPSDSPVFERISQILAAGLPVAAILGSLCLVAVTDGPVFFDLVGLATTAVIVTAAGRQLYLYFRAAQAREAERRAGQRLADEIRERGVTLLSLQRLLAGPTIEETARQVCREALRLEGIDLAVIRAYPAEGGVVPLAVEGLGPRAAALVGQPLQAARAAVIRSRGRGGSWEWLLGGEEESPYHATLEDMGVRATVNAPLRWNDAVIGDIGLGTCSLELAVSLDERLPTVEEFAVVVAALLGPALAEQDRAAALRRAIAAVLAARAFHPVFQPIVDLASSETVGYEALTRFDSGGRPDLCFADAWSVGLGADLELATLEDAVATARRLPAGLWLNLNVSPRLLGDPERLRDILCSADRPIVVEITEHEVIEDYQALRKAVGALGQDIRLAVDDAGAGVANFGHIIELRPDFVKLDISLVRGVNTDLGRQAVVAGMRHFARTAGCRLIAEGVETEEEARTLAGFGVEFGQGYLLGRPEPVEAWAGARAAA